MQINIGASIAALLYEHDSVTIPGLGAFVATYKPAEVDAVEGKILPPSKHIHFNKNLLIDDGLLVKQLREKYQLSYPEAMRRVDEFSKEIKDKIERREIVTFANVGRLYKDYEQNYQFLPTDTNFNADAYGLPVLQYQPVARASVRATAATTTPKAATPINANQKSWVQNNMLLLTTIGAMLMAVSLYAVLFYPKQRTQTQADTELPNRSTARYNVSPAELEGEEGATTVADSGETDDEGASDNATLAPGQKYCIISIGLFGNPENVDRMIKKAYEEGYEPYTEKSGKLTRVGIQLKYEREAEIEQALETIRKQFGTNAAVVKRLRN